ncbi:response regulator receiver protein [Thioclava dalianensis]|uniref:Response regulator receiver protein n=1 Tax=Thioclava dalianensis TaxID=1185766 RepID=A0A074TNC6_9RHOB|nr:response regulator [Thioclava dalianensis]KEP70498.1 response regulator receiver protein [Thioclava dalianensis]SFN08773.1 Response regulator receiver domain-containing protein [Thioclava dalianensis]
MRIEPSSHWLEGRKVLVAEDEMLIAYDIAYTIEDCGGEVIGPVANLSDARALMARDHIDAAVLDMNLLDGSCEPLVCELRKRNIPVVVNTAERLPLAFQSELPEVIVFSKPTMPDLLVEALSNGLHLDMRNAAE